MSTEENSEEKEMLEAIRPLKAGWEECKRRLDNIEEKERESTIYVALTFLNGWAEDLRYETLSEVEKREERKLWLLRDNLGCIEMPRMELEANRQLVENIEWIVEYTRMLPQTNHRSLARKTCQILEDLEARYDEKEKTPRKEQSPS